MKFKIDTKEKFQVLTINEPIISANIAAELTLICTEYLGQKIKNIILNLASVSSIENEMVAENLVELQQKFYENSVSFIICNLTKELENQLESLELLEVMNITPTESEAWDIVQMEEIERELLDDNNF